MRRVATLLTAPLIVLSLAGLVLAQTSAPPPATDAPPAASTPPTMVTPAQPVMPPATRPAGKAAGLRHMGGEVVSVNSDSRTMTVKHTGKKKTKQVTFTLGDMGALVAQSVTHRGGLRRAK
jgi:hypothetical protein